jgi:hypothetical protein
MFSLTMDNNSEVKGSRRLGSQGIQAISGYEVVYFAISFGPVAPVRSRSHSTCSGMPKQVKTHHTLTLIKSKVDLEFCLLKEYNRRSDTKDYKALLDKTEKMYGWWKHAKIKLKGEQDKNGLIGLKTRS